jgi:hypothetical protein
MSVWFHSSSTVHKRYEYLSEHITRRYVFSRYFRPAVSVFSVKCNVCCIIANLYTFSSCLILFSVVLTDAFVILLSFLSSAVLLCNTCYVFMFVR